MARKKSTKKKVLRDSAYYAKIGQKGGKKKTRGYFGFLQQTGQQEALRQVSTKGAEYTNRIRYGDKKNQADEENQDQKTGKEVV
jgi:hypothetical protein